MDEFETDCPYCGARLTLLIDGSAGSQLYTEDCHVCCQPILVNIEYDIEGNTTVSLTQENG